MGSFDIPVVLFIFKRKDATLQILNRVSQIKPKKLYLISDFGRTEEEEILVNECRNAVEEHINWDCKVIKNYAEKNCGVYDRIGLGAKWVFSMEPVAIFLEDDNLPELSFFYFCKELLEKYKDDNRILWICGTNYLENYKPEDGSSYVFTKHLLPCGWASWAGKFIKYYDADLALYNDTRLVKRVKYEYEDKRLYKQQIECVRQEYERKLKGERYVSWDYHMAYSIRVHNLYGISPKFNQIKNIGVDNYSEHGGVSLDNVMTKRFCGMESIPLKFPLTHPKTVMLDRMYESKVGNIILYPLSLRIKIKIAKLIKNILGMESNASITKTIKNHLKVVRK
ncbi:hypothetical protein RCG17_11665 [Neobacillus sp. PS3-12]|uniref:hypothetical protein n=1 Tax=Neobacillus sp. PS3-12 TaxID=3070677 RepID=UPI0027DED4CB|nr:hypothetical protein [Neobacillus sp. PS3-12]WML55180.1 hypothetical protein RCG17_11665 [Neobacillus sp. PS3-12]